MRRFAIIITIALMAVSAVAQPSDRNERRRMVNKATIYKSYELFYTDPVAAFTASPDSGVAPLEVTFTNISIGRGSSSWDFGDSTSSSEDSPTHEYEDAGTYPVSLRIDNDYGYHTAYDTITVASAGPNYAAMQLISLNMSSGKITAKNMTFPVSVTLTLRYWNMGTGTQIGTTKTAGPGTTLTVAGATCADGIDVAIQYTADTSVPGYDDVTSWVTAKTALMTNGLGDTGPFTALQP